MVPVCLDFAVLSYLPQRLFSQVVLKISHSESQGKWLNSSCGRTRKWWTAGCFWSQELQLHRLFCGFPKMLKDCELSPVLFLLFPCFPCMFTLLFEGSAQGTLLKWVFFHPTTQFRYASYSLHSTLGIFFLAQRILHHSTCTCFLKVWSNWYACSRRIRTTAGFVGGCYSNFQQNVKYIVRFQRIFLNKWLSGSIMELLTSSLAPVPFSVFH